MFCPEATLDQQYCGFAGYRFVEQRNAHDIFLFFLRKNEEKIDMRNLMVEISAGVNAQELHGVSIQMAPF